MLATLVDAQLGSGSHKSNDDACVPALDLSLVYFAQFFFCCLLDSTAVGEMGEKNNKQASGGGTCNNGVVRADRQGGTGVDPVVC